MLAWQHLTTANQRIKLAKRVLSLVAKYTTKRSTGSFLLAMHPEEAAGGRFCRCDDDKRIKKY